MTFIMSISSTCQLRAFYYDVLKEPTLVSVSTQHLHIGHGMSIANLAPFLPHPSCVRTARCSCTTLFGLKRGFYLYCSNCGTARPLDRGNCTFMVFRLCSDGTYFVNIRTTDLPDANDLVDRYLYMQYQQVPIFTCHISQAYSKVSVLEYIFMP